MAKMIAFEQEAREAIRRGVEGANFFGCQAKPLNYTELPKCFNIFLGR